VAAILDRLGVAYVTAVSLASSLHGEPRSTDDLDIVADLSRSQATSLVQALGGEWYVSADAVTDAVARGTSFNAIHLPSGVIVDNLRRGDGRVRRPSRGKWPIRTAR
jgi:hypothetical protein